MSDHIITYDLIDPRSGAMDCLAPADAPCHAVWDCGCETIYDYHVRNGEPHHYSTYDGDDMQVRGHHVGHFDADECSIRDWHENSDEDVTGTVAVKVNPVWHGDFYELEAISAEVTKP